MTKRTTTGQYGKGVSGNLGGRPKSDKLTQKERDGLVADAEIKLDDKSVLKKSIILMLKKAKLVSDLVKIWDKFGMYFESKKQSIKTEGELIRVIQITVKGYKNKGKELKVVNPTKGIANDTE